MNKPQFTETDFDNLTPKEIQILDNLINKGSKLEDLGRAKERYIELTRMLEKQSNQIAEDQKFAQKTLEEKQNFVSDLFKKFGTTPKEI